MKLSLQAALLSSVLCYSNLLAVQCECGNLGAQLHMWQLLVVACRVCATCVQANLCSSSSVVGDSHYLGGLVCVSWCSSKHRQQTEFRDCYLYAGLGVLVTIDSVACDDTSVQKHQALDNAECYQQSGWRIPRWRGLARCGLYCSARTVGRDAPAVGDIARWGPSMRHIEFACSSRWQAHSTRASQLPVASTVDQPLNA